MRDQEHEEFYEYEQLHESALAVKYLIEDSCCAGEEMWIPKSQIISDDGAKLTLTRWIAVEKGLV